MKGKTYKVDNDWFEILSDIADKHKILIPSEIDDYLTQNYNLPTERTPSEKFEWFLKDQGGLLNGHYPDRDPITSRGFFSVGDGWLPLIEGLITVLVDLGWDKHINQCKEKFGRLRYYIGDGNEAIWAAIARAEKMSGTICETCGQPGELGSNTFQGGWLKTRCEKHKDE